MTREIHTFQITGRYNAKHLAALIQMYESHDRHIRRRSDLVKNIITDLHTIMLNNGKLIPVTATDEAFRILDSFGIAPGAASSLSALIASIKTDTGSPHVKTLDDELEDMIKDIDL